MTLSATYDVFGRVTPITTLAPATGILWSKSVDGGITFHQFASTGAGVQSVVDKRPNKNYQWIAYTGSMTFVFTGVEFAVIGKPMDSQDYTVTIDDVPYHRTLSGGTDPGRVDAFDDMQILWGISGLSNAEHTVVITSPANGGGWWDGDEERGDPTYEFSEVLRGIWYSDISAPMGTETTYRAFVDGTTTEECTITPQIDRTASLQSLLDRLMAGDIVTAAGQADSPPTYGRSMQALASAYMLLSDSRIPAIAKAIYDAHWAACNHTTGCVESPPTLLMDGRNPQGFYAAYKAFKIVDPTNAALYLALADMIATFMRNTWVRQPAGVLSYRSNSAYQTGTGNHYSYPCYGLALLYNEPASAHYHDTTIYNLIINTMEYAVFDNEYGVQIDATTGAIYYRGNTIPEYAYACMEWPHIRYISEKFNWRTDEINLATQWLADTHGTTEPFFYRSEYHGYAAHHHILYKIIAYHKAHGTILTDLLDMLYSSACDNVWQLGASIGDFYDSEYQPSGYPADTEFSWAQMQATFFEGAMDAINLSSPLFPVYADATVNPALAIGSINPLTASFIRYIMAEVKPALATGSINKLDATYSRYFTAEVNPANALGSINKLAASVGGLSPFMYQIKGPGGVVYPFYIKTA